MSVVTYRDYVMAADTRAYSGSHTPLGSKLKIRKLREGGLVGVVTSNPGHGEALTAWVENGADVNNIPPINEPDFCILHVNGEGEIFFYRDSPYPSGPLEGDYFAIGSGADFALGAMAVGATAVEAAAAACELDTVCAGPVSSIQHVLGTAQAIKDAAFE